MAFSASDAAFEGFRIVRRTPLAVLAWGLTYIAAFIIGFALVGLPMIDLIQQGERLNGVDNPSMEQVLPLLRSYALVFSVVVPLSILVSTMLTTAIARAVLEPEAKRFGYLRLGMDEVRVFAALFVLLVLVFGYYVVAVVICVALGAAAHVSGQAWLYIPCVLAAIAAFLGLIWMTVKLSLVVPIIMTEKRIALFDSFKLTKGHFWPLLGMAVLAGIMSIVVSILGMIIATPFQIGLVGRFSEVQDLASLMPVLAQGAGLIIGWAVVNAVISALQLAVIYAPFSAAYRAIKGEAVA